MRLWSLHPRYLDARGLVACWREALLAQRVLAGHTRGYRRHPQLARFRAAPAPLGAIGAFLHALADEADKRGYRFDRGRIVDSRGATPIDETDGQLRFELEHLRAKLAVRCPSGLERLPAGGAPEPHPLFQIVPGDVREWERAAHTKTVPRPPRARRG